MTDMFLKIYWNVIKYVWIMPAGKNCVVLLRAVPKERQKIGLLDENTPLKSLCLLLEILILWINYQGNGNET